MCCGIKELDGIEDENPEEILLDATQQWFDEVPRAYMIFSCTSYYRDGTRLAKYIEKHNLGKTVRTKSKLNPNSGNHLIAWLWAVNNRTLKSWLKQRIPDYVEHHENNW